MDIAAQVGKDFFLDEKIPRHESGQGYVRVVEQSIMWRETETAKVFTYQGLTTCTELDKSWTVMSSIMMILHLLFLQKQSLVQPPTARKG